MKRSVLLFFIACTAFAGGSALAGTFSSVGVGQGVVLPHPGDTNPCVGSTLLLNADGSYENGYAWQYGGVAPPYYGAFAEGYHHTTYGVCGLQLMLTTLSGYYYGQTLDAYAWTEAGGNPGNVLIVTPNVSISPPAIWPNISVHDVDIDDVGTAGQDVFVGYWGNWPGLLCGWFVAADLDGYGGLPRTYIAPGIGYPTGWEDPSVIWGPTQALGIGVYDGGNIGPPPPPNPVDPVSWGRIKQLFD